MKTVRNKYAIFLNPAFIDLDVVGEAGGPADNPYINSKTILLRIVLPIGMPIS